jgi:hypothetical protein
MLITKSNMEYQETMNYWKQTSQLMKYFRAEEDPRSHVPKDFMAGFLEVGVIGIEGESGVLIGRIGSQLGWAKSPGGVLRNKSVGLRITIYSRMKHPSFKAIVLHLTSPWNADYLPRYNTKRKSRRSHADFSNMPLHRRLALAKLVSCLNKLLLDHIAEIVEIVQTLHERVHRPTLVFIFSCSLCQHEEAG